MKELKDEAEKIAIEATKKNLKKLLREIDEMKFEQIRDKLAQIISGMGYDEGYEIGYYEGKTGHSYALKEEGKE